MSKQELKGSSLSLSLSDPREAGGDCVAQSPLPSIAALMSV